MPTDPTSAPRTLDYTSTAPPRPSIWGSVSLLFVIPAVLFPAVMLSLSWTSLALPHAAWNRNLAWSWIASAAGIVAGVAGLFETSRTRTRAVIGLIANAVLFLLLPAFTCA